MYGVKLLKLLPTPAMKVLTLLILLLLPAAVSSGEDIFTYGGCQRLSAAVRSKVESMDRSFTEPVARDAQKELDKRLGNALTDPARSIPSTTKLLEYIEGWLLKKELLAARARHDHDADEAVDYCEFLLNHAGVR